ncbi:unnamed protein product [Paramecium pentaurelia]|uniref:Uncharacterized protein n=1 Tax=Paramecium pentaurelia TaxID=43138 RepID=A0A8S1S938_9CILI|nr:unnamed protein product [Paramecium pentaurelia]
MWLVGCFATQLFLGYPLFQKTSSFDQLSKIFEMISIQFIIYQQNQYQLFIHLKQSKCQNYFINQNQKLELKTLKMYEDKFNINLLDSEFLIQIIFSSCIWNPINQVQKQSKVQMGKKPIIRDGHYGILRRFTKEITRISFSFMFTASQCLQHPFLSDFQFNINEIIKQDLQQQ